MVRSVGIILVLLFFAIQSFAQSSVIDLVKEGIQYHDQGDYERAIATYEKALALEPKSPLVNYELALSYFTKQSYKEAIKYSNVVLKQNDKYLIEAYITKGSALDMLGKTKESIKLFKKAIDKTGGSALLYYNLGLNYFKIDDLDNAEESVIEAVKLNPLHSSSHLILAAIHDKKDNPVQTLLATHYFLLLEPNTKRSVNGYLLLEKHFGGNVSEDKNDPNTINIMLSPNEDRQFGAAELMISMLEASKSIEENEGKSADEMFVENTESFFKILGELKEKENKEIWWTFYTTFFYDLAKSKHLNTYCKYITQSRNENSRQWLSEHEEALLEFDEWLKGE